MLRNRAATQYCLLSPPAACHAGYELTMCVILASSHLVLPRQYTHPTIQRTKFETPTHKSLRFVTDRLIAVCMATVARLRSFCSQHTTLQSCMLCGALRSSGRVCASPGTGRVQRCLLQKLFQLPVSRLTPPASCKSLHPPMRL